MSLVAGTKLGPYEILSPLGAGGMGEVWKAKDTRLDRFVAIKVLPEHLVENADALARFEREAKAVAALNHPNILALHDLGKQDGMVFAVMELLEGESVRERLGQGPLPPRKAIELAVQMAHGLAAAHEKGVVHRDLKPDNLWITKDGRLKILDFGLAKQVPLPGGVAHAEMATVALGGPAQTEAGMILGTVRYMSPEQVRGENVDARSDIFSFGAVLFEMLTGQKAFARHTSADTMVAILKEEPPDFVNTSRPLPPGLLRVLHHCLEKDPAHRFQDAHDLAFALESLSDSSSSSTSLAGLSLPSRGPRLSWSWAVGISLALLGLGVLGTLGLGGHTRNEPEFHQLTFRRGNVLHARFTPDGQSVVYAATWDGQPTELFMARPDGTVTRPLGLSKANIMAVNKRGEMLVTLMGERWANPGNSGVLALMPMEGGTPRELMEGVFYADFGPDGVEIALTYRPIDGPAMRLDYPLGHKLFESGVATLSAPRVSPRGDRVAVTIYEPDGNALALFDRQGHRQDLIQTKQGLSHPIWSPNGSKIFFTVGRELRVTDLKGRQRVVRVDSSIHILHDVSKEERFLFERSILQVATVVHREGQERNLSCMDNTRVRALSQDGQWALLQERGLSSGPEGMVFLRRTDGGPPKSLGPGSALDLASDGRWALIRSPGQTESVQLVPTGSGAAREIKMEGWSILRSVFTPDGMQILITGQQGKGPLKLLSFPLGGGSPTVQAADPLGWNGLISKDGTQILALDEQRRPVLRPVKGGPPKILSEALEEKTSILGWDRENRLIVGHLDNSTSVHLEMVDLKTGKRSPWQVVAPADISGLIDIPLVLLTPDLQTVAYYYFRSITSDLFLADGLK